LREKNGIYFILTKVYNIRLIHYMYLSQRHKNMSLQQPFFS